MKRFLIALLGIGLSLTLAIFHFSLKADARPQLNLWRRQLHNRLLKLCQLKVT